MNAGAPIDPLEYPFDVPADSFLWTSAGAEPLPTLISIDELTADRQAVLAIGSNASVQQLSRKFNERRFVDPASQNGQIPVLRAEVDGVDVVYGAHLARYGSLPATLLDTPGACAQVLVTWLSFAQLERMNVSEGLGKAYQLRQVTGVRSYGKPVVPAVSYVTAGGVARSEGVRSDWQAFWRLAHSGPGRRKSGRGTCFRWTWGVGVTARRSRRESLIQATGARRSKYTSERIANLSRLSHDAGRLPHNACVLKGSLQHQPDWRTLIPFRIRRCVDVETL